MTFLFYLLLSFLTMPLYVCRSPEMVLMYYSSPRPMLPCICLRYNPMPSLVLAENDHETCCGVSVVLRMKRSLMRQANHSGTACSWKKLRSRDEAAREQSPTLSVRGNWAVQYVTYHQHSIHNLPSPPVVFHFAAGTTSSRNHCCGLRHPIYIQV